MSTDRVACSWHVSPDVTCANPAQYLVHPTATTFPARPYCEHHLPEVVNAFLLLNGGNPVSLVLQSPTNR